MEGETSTIASKKFFRKNLYTISFLGAICSALPAYINSSFLGEVMSKETVSIIYALGSIITIPTFIFFPKLVNRFGNNKVFGFLLILYALSFAGIIQDGNPISLGLFFMLNLIVMRSLSLSMDIYLENGSDDKETGLIRGLYLTSANLAWIIGPTATGILASNGEYEKVYAVCMIMLIPIALIFANKFKGFKDPVYEYPRPIKSLKEMVTKSSIRSVFITQTMLNFFFSWMVLYTPIYLHQVVGMSWQEMGPLFTIMLLPFLLFELPLGKMADRAWGEKELLMGGFTIIILSTIIFGLIPISSSFIIWATVLFITRVGASMAEVAGESYFFKQINGKDAELIGIYKLSTPLGYILGSILGGLFLFITDENWSLMFVVLGIISILPLTVASMIKDTK